MKFFIIKLIRLYQLTLSPDHSWLRTRYPYGFCRFYPSCSEYARQAVERHGVFRGGLKGLRRVLQCNPFNDPKIDKPRPIGL